MLSYSLMLVTCYTIYVIFADDFYEKVSTFCWGSLIPVPVSVIREKQRENWFKSFVFIFFEYWTIVYSLVAFLAVSKVTLMVVTFVAEQGWNLNVSYYMQTLANSYASLVVYFLTIAILFCSTTKNIIFVPQASLCVRVVYSWSLLDA